MVAEYSLSLEGRICTVVVSDEPQALRDASAAGKAVIGLYRAGGPEADAGEDGTKAGEADAGTFLPARYAVEGLEAADEAFMEKVARRHYGLPCIVARTKRLAIRELTGRDAAYLPDLRSLSFAAQPAFEDAAHLEAYVQNQYPFYGYGMWGLERSEDGELMGVAGLACPSGLSGLPGFSDLPGLSDGNGACLELGFGLFPRFRGQGYAREACEAILDGVCGGRPDSGSGWLPGFRADGWHGARIYARTEPDNAPSLGLLGRLGFRPVEGTQDLAVTAGRGLPDSGGTQCWFRYGGTWT